MKRTIIRKRTPLDILQGLVIIGPLIAALLLCIFLGLSITKIQDREKGYERRLIIDYCPTEETE